jgi:cytochrome c oxidase assembly protein subunit 15
MTDTLTSLRRWSLAALLTNVMIVVTGGAVRVTGSGLGCSEWPACEGGSVVPAPGAEAGWRQLVEFGNRLLSFVVLAAVVGAYLAARRHLAERRSEGGLAGRGIERRLAGWLIVGVLAQAVLGGITVRLELHWATVMSHFLLSMVLVGIAALLHLRVTTARFGADEPRVPVARWVPVAGAVVLVLGTIVTASGPHAGDPGTGRLGLPIRAVARTHSASVWLTVGLTVLVLVQARRLGASATARAAGLLLAVEVLQGAVGYWQYLTGVPARLVLVHMLLAAVFWIAAVRVGAIGAAARQPTDAPTADLVA